MKRPVKDFGIFGIGYETKAYVLIHYTFTDIYKCSVCLHQQTVNHDAHDSRAVRSLMKGYYDTLGSPGV